MIILLGRLCARLVQLRRRVYRGTLHKATTSERCFLFSGSYRGLQNIRNIYNHFSSMRLDTTMVDSTQGARQQEFFYFAELLPDVWLADLPSSNPLFHFVFWPVPYSALLLCIRAEKDIYLIN